MRVLDLFSGIGGFSLGLERAGMTTVAFCEIEEYPRRVLRKHWPEVPIFGDIRELTSDQVGPVELICGGYPCQPFSTAGKRGGQDDDRHLWPEMLRLVRECRPRWVIAENVAGHISMGLDDVLSDLEAEGYTCWPFVIPAVAVDAKHRRDRLWILAANSECLRSTQQKREHQRPEILSGCSQDKLVAGDDLADAGGRRCCGEESREIQQPGRAEIERPSQDLANPNSERGLQQERGKQNEWRRVSNGSETLADSDSDSAERIKPCEPNAEKRTVSGRRQAGSCGNGDGRWPAEPGVGRVANGVPNRAHRIRCLGNAVVPQIPEILGRAIMASEDTA